MYDIISSDNVGEINSKILYIISFSDSASLSLVNLNTKYSITLSSQLIN